MGSTVRKPKHLSPKNSIFLILSFEGPDRYSLAGGLGMRVTQLANTLARKGYPTRILFVGDPQGAGEEYQVGGRLVLHRWCQWISQYHPNGVYDGEEPKLHDFNQSVPSFVLEQIARPAIAEGKTLVILGEEWHTAELMWRLSDLFYQKGVRDKVVLFWNANNTTSFHRIDWKRLDFTTTITTVSKYMKHLMWPLGVNAHVIPNGIPSASLEKVDEREVVRLRGNLRKDLILCKVARWDPDKGWQAAVEATATLKRAGLKVVLLARGGIEPHGHEVLRHAARLGLHVADAYQRGDGHDGYQSAIAQASECDVINIRSHLPLDFLRVLYRGSHAVLANSGHEPFGLVGLETMASGGVAFTGATGEDYAIHNYNCVVQETGESSEIVSNLMDLRDHPVHEEKIRKAARVSARSFTWEKVVDDLVSKVEQKARAQGALARITPPEPRSLRPRLRVTPVRAA
ncbi:MAG: glycosyltransferase [Dehalococcoidia bacterium]|nr:glycosyltransferase [Dehalococcoidia bacterium]